MAGAEEEGEEGAAGGGGGGAAAGAGTPPQHQQQGGQGGQEEITSSTAYLLVYRQRGAELPGVALDPGQLSWLEEAGARLAAARQEAAAGYAAAKEELLDGRAARQEEVRGVVEAAGTLGEGDAGCFVAAEWLAKWADADVVARGGSVGGGAAEGGPPAHAEGGVDGSIGRGGGGGGGGSSSGVDAIDNSLLLCPHGRLDPGAAASAARRVSTPAWEQLAATYRGGPRLGPADACHECLAAQLAAVAAAEDSQGLRDQFLAVAAALVEEGGAEAVQAEGLVPAYWVSKPWLRWVGLLLLLLGRGGRGGRVGGFG